ncbi:hypothetical protein [Candidatus Villigracilis affinis]|jgi:hypothetical protein|uniref:hypothetical protein n=1 Tax=Candidatus Villigracilis affinis TaxID=3140682 RepID=UPI001DBEC973|nr:hypothetical protein [Anaerolineales bacterium]
MSISQRLKTGFIVLLGLYLSLTWLLVYFATREDRVSHAIISMGSGLLLLWVALGGSCMVLFRDRIKTCVQSIPLNWQVKFILFGISLAMIEEVITTTMTNLAPLFGVAVGEAYITASASYFDVILHHSVIVFVPWFFAWAWILKRYDFSPFWVFLFLGLQGLIGESIAFGAQNLSQFAMWIFVYGLMIYLPAYTIPAERGARKPNLLHAILAFFLPLLSGFLWAILINLLFPSHPSIHFPPIQN